MGDNSGYSILHRKIQPSTVHANELSHGEAGFGFANRNRDDLQLLT